MEYSFKEDVICVVLMALAFISSIIFLFSF